MPARLTPTWRVIVRIEMEGSWYGLLPEASIARHAIEACGRFRGAAHHGTARRRRTTPQDQLNTPVHWARWTVRQQLTLRRHQARPKPRLGSLCVVSVRARAKGTRSQCPWYCCSTPTYPEDGSRALKVYQHQHHGCTWLCGSPTERRRQRSKRIHLLATAPANSAETFTIRQRAARSILR